MAPKIGEMTAPVTVLVPTIGRPLQLRNCLESLARCDPAAAELLVVDQSAGDEVERAVEEFTGAAARHVRSHGTGRALALNDGLREASHDVVFSTSDDCTVDSSWIGVGWRLMKDDSAKLVTGRVLPAGDAASVPSTIDDPSPREFTGQGIADRLYGGNMVLSRPMALALGGFDERVEPAAEDNDFGYRWLRAGWRMLYEPGLTVWHHDWRDAEALSALYLDYAIGQGVFYAKHLRRGDKTIARMLIRDLAYGAAASVQTTRANREFSIDPHVRAIVRGVIDGWRRFGARDH